MENLYRFIKSIQQKTTFEPNEIDGYKAQAVLEVAYESSRSGSWSAGRMSNDSRRITIDTEDYRSRRESSLVRFAQSAAEQVRRTGQPRLLEAMNPIGGQGCVWCKKETAAALPMMFPYKSDKMDDRS